jgi:hypothetical protein
MLSVALKEDYRIAGALNGGALSYGHTLAYKGANQQYSNAFNKLAHATCVELRDYDGSEQQKAVNYVAHALTAHLRDPSLLPKRRQKSLFIMP